jgi:hypothetical protein
MFLTWPCGLAEAYKICEDLDLFSDTSLGFFCVHIMSMGQPQKYHP